MFRHRGDGLIKKRLTTKQIFLLAAAALIAAAGIACVLLTASQRPREIYDAQVVAAEHMQQCMDAVKSEKNARGIEISAEDKFDTGLIGEEFNFITTTLGDVAAKRTSTDPDMAALLVLMFTQAGLESGDRLACNFSGSFPALNIAVLCACEALDITPVYICSVGASTWGANNPEFSFPEMADLLYKLGLIKTAPALITPGAGSDTGKGVDEELFSAIWDKIGYLGYPTMTEDDFGTNVAARRKIFGSCDAFIAVGGNITSLGYNQVTDIIGQGIITEHINSLNDNSGLIEYYLYEGVPTMLLLNIRQLCADYEITFDPAVRTDIGEGSIYRETAYEAWIIIIMLIAEAALLVIYKKLA